MFFNHYDNVLLDMIYQETQVANPNPKQRRIQRLYEGYTNNKLTKSEFALLNSYVQLKKQELKNKRAQIKVEQEENKELIQTQQRINKLRVHLDIVFAEEYKRYHHFDDANYGLRDKPHYLELLAVALGLRDGQEAKVEIQHYGSYSCNHYDNIIYIKESGEQLYILEYTGGHWYYTIANTSSSKLEKSIAKALDRYHCEKGMAIKKYGELLFHFN